MDNMELVNNGLVVMVNMRLVNMRFINTGLVNP